MAILPNTGQELYIVWLWRSYLADCKIKNYTGLNCVLSVKQGWAVNADNCPPVSNWLVQSISLRRSHTALEKVILNLQYVTLSVLQGEGICLWSYQESLVDLISVPTFFSLEMMQGIRPQSRIQNCVRKTGEKARRFLNYIYLQSTPSGIETDC